MDSSSVKIHSKLKLIIDNYLQLMESKSIYSNEIKEIKTLEQINLDSLLARKSSLNICDLTNSILMELGRIKQSIVTRDLFKLNEQYLQYRKEIESRIGIIQLELQELLMEYNNIEQELIEALNE